jgi:purine-binding chemotaxis protein CheW
MKDNYLLFRLGERLFGVRMRGAKEILPWRRSRPVPLSYSYIEGLMEYRGAIYPVFQLSALLGISRPGPIGFTAQKGGQPGGRSIILFQEENKVFGVSVDSVVKMSPLEETEGKPPDIDGINLQLVTGTSYDDNQEIILLSFERLFHAG